MSGLQQCIQTTTPFSCYAGTLVPSFVISRVLRRDSCLKVAVTSHLDGYLGHSPAVEISGRPFMTGGTLLLTAQSFAARRAWASYFEWTLQHMTSAQKTLLTTHRLCCLMHIPSCCSWVYIPVLYACIGLLFSLSFDSLKNNKYNSTLMKDTILECLPLNSNLALSTKQWLLWKPIVLFVCFCFFPWSIFYSHIPTNIWAIIFMEVNNNHQKSITLCSWYLGCFFISLPNKLFRQQSFSALASGAGHLRGRAGCAAASWWMKMLRQFSLARNL